MQGHTAFVRERNGSQRHHELFLSAVPAVISHACCCHAACVLCSLVNHVLTATAAMQCCVLLHLLRFLFFCTMVLYAT